MAYLDTTLTSIPYTGDTDSLEASDDVLTDIAPVEHPYCPPQLLNRFCLLMAGHGRCIHCAMMLGDREYAMWQLARAFATDDQELRELTTRLFPYFDEQRR